MQCPDGGALFQLQDGGMMQGDGFAVAGFCWTFMDMIAQFGLAAAVVGIEKPNNANLRIPSVMVHDDANVEITEGGVGASTK